MKCPEEEIKKTNNDPHTHHNTENQTPSNQKDLHHVKVSRQLLMTLGFTDQFVIIIQAPHPH